MDFLNIDIDTAMAKMLEYMHFFYQYAPFFYSRVASFAIFFLVAYISGTGADHLLQETDHKLPSSKAAYKKLKQLTSLASPLQNSLPLLMLSGLLMSLQFTPLIFHFPQLFKFAKVDWFGGAILGIVAAFPVRKILRGWQLLLFTLMVMVANIVFSIIMAESTSSPQGLLASYDYGYHAGVILTTILIIYFLAIRGTIQERLARARLLQVPLLLKLGKPVKAEKILARFQGSLENWQDLTGVIKAMDSDTAIRVLEGFEPGRRRDILLLSKLLAGKSIKDALDDILQIFSEYSQSEATALLKEAELDDDKRLLLKLILLASHDDIDQARELLSDLGLEERITLVRQVQESRLRTLLLVELWLAQGKPEKAYQELNKSVGTDLNEILSLLEKIKESRNRALMTGWVLDKANEAGKAIEYLEKFFTQGELDDDYLPILARGYEATGRIPDAIMVFQEMLRRNPGDEDTMVRLCRLNIDADMQSDVLNSLAGGDMSALQEQTLLELARYFLHFGVIEAMKRCADAAVETWHSVDAAMLLGRVLEEQGDLLAAAESYGKAGKDGLLKQGLCLFQLGDFAAAVPVLKRVQTTRENRPGVLYHIAYAAYSANMLPDAIDAFMKLDSQRHDPVVQRDLTICFTCLAMEARDKGDFQQAFECLEQAIERAPDTMEAEKEQIRTCLADTIFQLAFSKIASPNGVPGEIDRLLEQAGSLVNRSWPELDFLKALNSLKQHNIEKALQKFSLLCRKYPDNISYAYHRILALVMTGKTGHVRREVERLAETRDDPYAARARVLLAVMEMKEGNWEVAEEKLRAAISV